ncbi:hypothetical protein TNCV_4465861 [Trichonephila clavipes]|nr:hypothetical protein TNCV_4465861 [Trichonephila clavipes]
MRGLAARRLFRVPPCREGTIHLQTSMPSLVFESRPSVSVTNHYNRWEAHCSIRLSSTNKILNRLKKSPEVKLSMDELNLDQAPQDINKEEFQLESVRLQDFIAATDP